MANFVTLLVAVTAAATVTSMPILNPDLQDIAAIATQACPATENNEIELLSVFHAEMMEGKDVINTTLLNNSQWINVLGNSKASYCAEKTSTFIIQIVGHSSFSEIQDLRLRSLLQMSNYVHFLKSYASSTTDYTDATTQLHYLWKKVNNVVFTLGQLLSTVSCEDILVYIERDVGGHVITAPQTLTESSKRLFLYCVLELMLWDFQAILESI